FSIIQFPADFLTLHYFSIFDRFGDMVYESEDWPVIWNGTAQNGRPNQPGVYAYILIYSCGESRIVEHGNITLVR
ncbi:MAG: gliding motility-associated C-terminal domain-containing protein, partial [Bacteroidota bacterium]|nr:gliding motility-associated C-terminal domain-containing protein [Bacteroidota bacterium]